MCITALLHEDVQYLPMLVDGPPQVHSPAVHPEEDLIQVPRLAAVHLPAPQVFSEEGAELVRPRSYGFI
jgi:hypothetical protein